MTMNSKPYTVKSHRLRVRCSSCLYPNCSTDPFSSAIVTSTNVDSTSRHETNAPERPPVDPLPGRASLRKRWGAPLASLIQNGPPSRVKPSPLVSPRFPRSENWRHIFPLLHCEEEKQSRGRATKGLSSRNSYNSGLSERLGTEMRSTISTGQGWQP